MHGRFPLLSSPGEMNSCNRAVVVWKSLFCMLRASSPQSLSVLCCGGGGGVSLGYSVFCGGIPQTEVLIILRWVNPIMVLLCSFALFY